MTNSEIKNLRVASVQIPGDHLTSATELFDLIEQTVLAAVDEHEAGLVMLPELVTLALVDFKNLRGFHDKIHFIAHQVTHPLFEMLQDLARTKGVYIAGCSSPRVERLGKAVGGAGGSASGGATGKPAEEIRNTAVWISPDGDVTLQDKLFLTPFESKWGWAPGETLKILKAPWGPTAILICHDAEFPSISKMLVGAAPTLLLVPSMTDDKSGFNRVRLCCAARAIEHHCFVVHSGIVEAEAAASAAGFSEAMPGNGFSSTPNDLAESRHGEYSGQGAILTPHSEDWPGQLAVGPWNQPGLVLADLDFNKLIEFRSRRDRVYPGRDERGRLQMPVLQMN